MEHKFTIKKPSNLAAVVSKVSSEIKKDGGTFSGDVNSGNFSGDGVVGSYKTTGEKIEITITKATFLATGSMVEKEIRKALNELYG